MKKAFVLVPLVLAIAIVALPGEARAALLAGLASNGTYFNIHTTAFPVERFAAS